MEFIDGMRDALPDGYGAAILWVLFAILLLVAVLGLIRVIRGMTGGTFVSGGRSRRTRLAVMDAAPVDARRRLILVRRDEVEHLILIGGPTDVVIERDIRIASRPSRSSEALEEATLPAHTSPELERARAQVRPQAPQPKPEPPRPVEPKTPPRPIAVNGAAPLPRPAMPMPAPPPAPAMPKPAATRPFEFSKAPAASPRMPQAKSLDDTLLTELALSLEDAVVPAEKEKKPAGSRRSDPSIDEQMNKLLGEISKKK